MTFAEQLDARAYRHRLVEAADWPKLTSKLTSYARRKVGKHASEDAAEELAHEAIAHFIEHLASWEPSKHALLAQLTSALNGIASNRRRSRRLMNEHLAHEDDVAADSSKAPADFRTGEALHLAADLSRATVTRLEASLAGDALAIAIVGLFLRDITSPKDQQEATKREMKEILAARLKIARHASKVADELDAEVA